MQALITTPRCTGAPFVACPARIAPLKPGRSASSSSSSSSSSRATVVRCSASGKDQTTDFPRMLLQKGAALAAAAVLLTASVADARLEGVNKPELLPQGEVTPVIDVAGFLTPGEEKRIRSTVERLETDTGFKLRVLAQNYPETPGLAIKDYWGVDGSTVVFVADPNTGNILNFNVGADVDLAVPRNFWTRLANKYGTKKYWEKNGQEAAIVNAVTAINTCLREPIGKFQCTNIQGALDNF